MRSRIAAAALLLRLFVANSAFAQHGRPPSSSPPTPTESTATSSQAAANPGPARTANDAVYAEIGGPSLFYAVNFDRRFNDFSARIGFGFLHWSSPPSPVAGTGGASKSFFSLPFSLSYLGAGSQTNMFELGMGVSMYGEHKVYGPSADHSYEGSSRFKTSLLPNVLVGYRRQPADGGFILRTGLSLLLATGDLAPYRIPAFPWPYLALGAAFD
jgi:hypothetical protein